MNAEIIWIGKHGPIAPGFIIDERWPLVGKDEGYLWQFNGFCLRLRHKHARNDDDFWTRPYVERDEGSDGDAPKRAKCPDRRARRKRRGGGRRR